MTTRRNRTATGPFWLWLTLASSLVVYLAACQGSTGLRRVTAVKSGGGYAVAVSADHAYVANNDGVLVFNVETPRRPREVGLLEMGYAGDLHVQDGRAHVAGQINLVIADVTDPSNPRRVGVYDGPGLATGLSVVDPYVYLAGSEGLEIVDAGDPAAPVRVGSLGGVYARGVAVHGNVAYLAVPDEGLLVIDVSDPASPGRLRTVPDTGGAWDVHLDGEHVYLACHGNGVRILSMSDPESPRVIGRVLENDDGGEALGLRVVGELLFVSDNTGIEVFDVSDPARPVEIAEYGRVDGAHELFVDGSYVYIAEGHQGLIVLEYVGDQGG